MTNVILGTQYTVHRDSLFWIANTLHHRTCGKKTSRGTLCYGLKRFIFLTAGGRPLHTAETIAPSTSGRHILCGTAIDASEERSLPAADRLRCAPFAKSLRAGPSSPPPAGSQGKQDDGEKRKQRPRQRRPAEAGRYRVKCRGNGEVKDARLKGRRPLPVDPALRDLRMNRAVARFRMTMLFASSGAYAEGGVAFLPGEFVACDVGPARFLL